MKWIICIYIVLVVKPYALANSNYSLSLSVHSGEILVWQEKSIKNKNIKSYLISYKSPSGPSVDRVLPREEYFSSVKALKRWRKNLTLKQTSIVDPLCLDKVIFEENKVVQFICLSGVDSAEKTKYFRWVREQTDLVSGRSL